MSENTTSDLFEVDEVQGVTVVRFKCRTILDPLLIDVLGQKLLALVKEQGRRRLVLNFAHVESVTMRHAGALVALYHAVNAAEGRIVFAAVDPFLMQIFRLCNLPLAIPIHPSEADAVHALAAV